MLTGLSPHPPFKGPLPTKLCSAAAVSNIRDAVFAGFLVFIPLNHIQPILHHNAMLYLVSNTSALIGIWRTCSVVV